MSSEKSDAIVLRVIPFSESSVIVTLLTRDFGKIAAMAKGAYRPRSAFEGALDLGCHCRVVFIKKNSDALDLLTEAKLLRRFRAGDKSLAALYVGYYVLELVRELTDESEPHPELFDLALRMLTQIDDETCTTERLRDLLATFELQALTTLGHTPSINSCASCGVDVPEADHVALGMASGGVLCDGCRPGSRHVVMLNRRVRDAIRQRISNNNQVLELHANENRVTGELSAVLNRYMSHHVGHELRMPKLIDAIQFATKNHT